MLGSNLHIENKDNISNIVIGCKKNNEKAQEMLYRLYAPYILTICRRYSSVDFDAEDLMQETFITVFDKIRLFDEQKGNIMSWIKTIAINIALKKIRDRKHNFIDISSLDFIDNLEDIIDFPYDQLSEQQLIAIIQDLPVGYRTVFNMYVIDNYSHKEIAELLKIKEVTSKSQLHKARKMLKQMVTEALQFSEKSFFEPKYS